MVFPSVPAYLDPPNWNNQQGQQPRASGGGGSAGDAAAQHMPPVGPTAAALAASSSAAGNEAAGQQQQQQARPNPHSMTERARMARAPHPEPALKCPRCDSTNTKFCYYNNYSLSQPRHFCKACRRYWTRGGALRSVPVGGGCRRNKRSSNKSSSSKPSSSSANRQQLPGGASSSASILPSTAPGSGVPSGGMIPPVGLGSSMAHHLPFLGSMQQHPPGAGPNLGLAFSVGLPPLGIGMHQQQHNMDGVDQSSFPLASGGGAATFGASLEQQWRVQQQQQPHQQQFPFLELPPGPPMYQLGALQGNRAAGSSAAAPSGMFTLGQTAASATATAARHERSVKQAADDDSKGGQEMSLQRQYMEALRQQGDQGVWGGSGSGTDDGNNGSGSWTMNLPGFHSSSTGGHGGGLL